MVPDLQNKVLAFTPVVRERLALGHALLHSVVLSLLLLLFCKPSITFYPTTLTTYPNQLLTMRLGLTIVIAIQSLSHVQRFAAPWTSTL